MMPRLQLLFFYGIPNSPRIVYNISIFFLIFVIHRFPLNFERLCKDYFYFTDFFFPPQNASLVILN